MCGASKGKRTRILMAGGLSLWESFSTHLPPNSSYGSTQPSPSRSIFVSNPGFAFSLVSAHDSFSMPSLLPLHDGRSPLIVDPPQCSARHIPSCSTQMSSAWLHITISSKCFRAFQSATVAEALPGCNASSTCISQGAYIVGVRGAVSVLVQVLFADTAHACRLGDGTSWVAWNSACNAHFCTLVALWQPRLRSFHEPQHQIVRTARQSPSHHFRTGICGSRSCAASCTACITVEKTISRACSLGRMAEAVVARLT